MGGRRGVFAGFVGLVVVAGGVLSGCSSGAQGASGPDAGPTRVLTVYQAPAELVPDPDES